LNIKYKIEPGTQQDFPELTAVWEASVKASHHFLSEEDIQFYKPLVKNEYLKLLDIFLARRDNGSIAGFVGLADNKIEMLFIASELRGRGIGKTLLAYAIVELNAREVDVNEQNEAAVAFYLSQGFKIRSRSKLDSTGKNFPILHLSL